MLSTTRSRVALLLSSRARFALRRSYAFTANEQEPLNDTTPPKKVPNVSKTNEVPIQTPNQDERLQEYAEDAEKLRVMQAPNRTSVWSRSQNPRGKAMTGPRFEQTIMELQPAPEAAVELIHKQPVRWVHKSVVECDGGGGPLGHPRIFINVDKPQICMCTYCGLPYAHEHHRKHLESLPSTTYPLGPHGDAAEVPVSQRITDEALGQR